MRQATCAACEKRVPMRDAFSVAQRTLCVDCADQFLKEQGKGTVQPGDVSRLVDPTVCAECAKDCGDQELSTIASLPVCEACDNRFRKRPFPSWLKISFVAFLLVAVAAFVYNLRFFLAYVDIVHANRELRTGKVEQGIGHYAAAAERIPEMPELAVLPNLYRAEMLAGDDKFDEATALLQKSRPHASPNMRRQLDLAELHVQSGRAFNNKDYDAFLKVAQQMNEMVPGTYNTLGSLASAYACKYAVTGDPPFRDQAIQYMEKAKAVGPPEKDMVEDFESRLQYRLHTREIISRKQFMERFPNGWKPGDAK